jgi:Fe(3+) dicitrate transport protein
MISLRIPHLMAVAPLLAAALPLHDPLMAQRGPGRDTLPTVRVQGTTRPAERLPEVDNTRITTARRTESLRLQAGHANLSLNNVRQTFARAPGLMVWEQDGAGIQAGVAARGLSPNRSWEFNVRANGVDIAADAFGYPEAYYTPPFRSLERIEIIRGATSLQYGSQYGGVLNYITKRGPRDRTLAVEASQQGGAFGLYSGFLGAGGTAGRTTWYAYGDTRRGNGWRANSRFETAAAGAHVQVRTSPRGVLGATLTWQDYTLQQPGGLTEAHWRDNAQQSFRARDRFGAPWLVPSLTYDHAFGRTTVNVRTFGLRGERNSIGVIRPSSVADSGVNPRRVDVDRYRNVGMEARVLQRLGDSPLASALVFGVRASQGRTNRVRGRGADGDVFSTTLTAPATLDLDLRARNLAAFAEASLNLTSRIAITPGVRLEHLDGRGSGESFRAATNFTRVTDTLPTSFGGRTRETIPLFGVGARWMAAAGNEVYANVARAYRPATFAEQFQNDLVSVDPEIRSSRGWSADVGVRGTHRGWLRYDVSAFRILYGDRIGTVARSALGADSVRFPFGVRRNIGESVHLGVESLLEADLLRRTTLEATGLSVFASTGYTQAEYTAGAQRGKRVEYAPRWTARGGVSGTLAAALTGTLQVSHVSAVFSDAANTPAQADGQQGRIPGYAVVDFTASARLRSGVMVDLSVNNLLDRRYFTRRATGYPGPGIVPADGRLVTAGVRLDWARR